MDTDQNALFDEVGADPVIGSHFNPKDGLGGFYAPIPDWLMIQPVYVVLSPHGHRIEKKLPFGVKCCYGTMVKLTPKEGEFAGKVKVSCKALGRAMGVSRRSATDWIKVLVAIRLIEKMDQAYQIDQEEMETNTYRFLLHEWMLDHTN